MRHLSAVAQSRQQHEGNDRDCHVDGNRDLRRSDSAEWNSEQGKIHSHGQILLYE